MKIRKNRLSKVGFLSVIGLVIALFINPFGVVCHGQERVDLQELVVETQKSSSDINKVTTVWWIPKEFWVETFAQDPTVTETDANQFVDVFKQYTMLAVVDGEMGTFSTNYKTEEQIRDSIIVKDTDGRTHTPLPKYKVNTTTQTFIQIMKPLIANSLGAMGQNMHFVLFQNKNGNPVVSAMEKGSFEIILGEEEFKFRLPLGSLLPPKYDPSTGEKFPGNYNYNPFNGNKLVEQKPNS